MFNTVMCGIVGCVTFYYYAKFFFSQIINTVKVFHIAITASTHLFLLAVAPPSFMQLPRLGATSVLGILGIYPSMLHWIFGVLYAELAFRLPSLDLLYFLVLFLDVWEFTVVMDVDEAGVGDVGWVGVSGVPIQCCLSILYFTCSVCSISPIQRLLSIVSWILLLVLL